MSASRPVGNGECRLRISSPYGERFLQFCSIAQAIRYLHSTLSKASRVIEREAHASARVPRIVPDYDEHCVLCVRETPYQWDNSRFGAIWAVKREWTAYRLCSHAGKHLHVSHVLQLLTAHGNLKRKAVRRRVPHGARGSGLIAGIHKRRRGYRFFRDVRTFAEKRKNALILRSEGEPHVRAARRSPNLPSSWNEMVREVQRSWKEQGKARKQWDR